jgi:mannose-1-phosphate guanylyltransferase
LKAFLLAAGVGKRLRPLTDLRPKCLMPVAGRPLLDYWLSLCWRHGVDEVLINLHHHADQVREYLDAREGDALQVQLFPEERLLGSGGTLAANRDFVRGEKDFLVLYADNLTNVDLDALIRFHRAHDGLITLGLFHTAVPKQCGIVELDETGKVCFFEEKPARPRTDLANAGVMVMDTEVFSLFPDAREFDLGHDLLPKLAGRMYGKVIEEYLQDIGTFEKYLNALRSWQGLEQSRADLIPAIETMGESS